MLNIQSLQGLNNRNTPYYFYDTTILTNTLIALNEASLPKNYHVHYAMKANSNIPILHTIKNHNIGIDCVSGNELQLAIEQGFDTSKIAFAGVGKTDDEINLAIEHNILSINCESIQEIQVINDLAQRKNKIVNISLRINPNLEADTHPNITTGTLLNKFGISIESLDNAVDLCANLNNINLNGIHFHIGSQIRTGNPYINLCNKVNSLVQSLTARGVALDIVNLGGGLGINYTDPDSELIPDFEGFFSIFHKHLNLPNTINVHFELGRSIVGQCGNLVTKTLFTKGNHIKEFVIVDAGMTDLMRPALYNGYHKIQNISSVKPNKTYEVVGPICETTDTFNTQVSLPETSRGDLLVIRSVGAYGEVMASNYNLRVKPNAYYSLN